MGIPVVATDLPEIRRFNADHGDVVSVAGDADAFVGGDPARAAGDSAPGRRWTRRIAVAQQNSWQSRIAAMCGLIDEAIERRARVDAGDGTRRCGAPTGATRTPRREIVLGVAAVLPADVPDQRRLVGAPRRSTQSAPPQPADAIVVFAGGVGESGKAGGGAQERLKQAVDLYKAGYAPFLILSSGYVYSFHEAEVMRALAIDQGVPAVRDRARRARHEHLPERHVRRRRSCDEHRLARDSARQLALPHAARA